VAAAESLGRGTRASCGVSKAGRGAARASGGDPLGAAARGKGGGRGALRRMDPAPPRGVRPVPGGVLGGRGTCPTARSRRPPSSSSPSSMSAPSRRSMTATPRTTASIRCAAGSASPPSRRPRWELRGRSTRASSIVRARCSLTSPSSFLANHCNRSSLSFRARTVPPLSRRITCMSARRYHSMPGPFRRGLRSLGATSPLPTRMPRRGGKA
jgi:hypothetical protein